MDVQDYGLTLVEKKYIAEDVLYLSFHAPISFSFEAGQYILVKIEREEKLRWKSYSILNPPSEKGKIDLCVTIIPGGLASERFKEAQVGEKFVCKGPLGHFVFAQESEHQEQWFICAGTGITPFYSMIKEFAHQQPAKKFVLLFGEKTKDDLLFYTELSRMQKELKNFIYMPTLSREGWDGKKGHVQLHLPEDVGNKTFYICGLRELVLETREILEKKGVNPEDIKVERYT